MAGGPASQFCGREGLEEGRGNAGAAPHGAELSLGFADGEGDQADGGNSAAGDDDLFPRQRPFDQAGEGSLGPMHGNRCHSHHSSILANQFS